MERRPEARLAELQLQIMVKVCCNDSLEMAQRKTHFSPMANLRYIMLKSFIGYTHSVM